MAKSKYETHVAPRLEEIKDWCRNGAIDEEIISRLGISRKTFYELKKNIPEFSDTLKEMRDVIDAQVESALLQNALNGKITAQIFWLKNRRPEKWRDKPAKEQDGHDNSSDAYSAETLRNALLLRHIEEVDDDDEV